VKRSTGNDLQYGYYTSLHSMKLTVIIFALLCACSSAFAQGALQLPWVNVQFTDSSGHPLANGRVYTSLAGTSCPGSCMPTYNSSSGLIQNSNPVLLDGAGRASIWLVGGTSYRVVATDSTGSPQSIADNVRGAIVTAPSGGSGSACGPPGQMQFSGTGSTFGCSPNLTWNNAGQVLGITGTVGQAALGVYSGYIQTFGGVLSTVSGGGSWNAFNSPTDGAALRGYYVAQTTSNNAGGYVDLAPITYNPYNGAPCTDTFGNSVQQPLPLNGSSGFGANDALIWVGISPSMPSGGSCGAPLPIPTQNGINTNAHMFARGGFATDNPAYNSIQSLLGGAYLKLGLTTDQAVYPKAYSASTSLNPPAAGYGGLAYQGGSNYYYYNATSGTWNLVNLAATGGGGTAQGPANAIQTQDATGSGVFTGYSWLTAVPGSQSLIALGGFTTSSGAGACTAFNCIQAPLGGLFSGLGVTANQAFYPKAYVSSASLNPPAAGYGGLGYAGSTVGSGATYYYYNAMTPGWASVDFSASGSGCTLGATATGQIIFNLSGACTSSANLAWANGTNILTVGGTVQSTVGFNATSSISPNAIQAPNGGLLAGLGVTANQAFYPKGYVSSGSLNPPASGYGGIGYTGTGLGYWVWNATSSAWVSVNLGAVGGSVAGPNCAVQYNNSGAFGGDGNLCWNSSTHVLNISGALQILGVNSINTSNQFVGAGGVNTAAAILSGSTIQSTISSGVAFQAGSGAFQAFANGNVNGLNLNASTSLEVNGTAVVDVSHNLVNILNETASGTIQTTATGGTVGFQAGGGNFQAFGNGNVNGLNINAASSFEINGVVVVNSSRQFTGTINTAGGGTFGSGVTFTSGIVASPGSNSSITIGSSGNFFTRFIGSSTGVSCSGVADGWNAVASDGYIVYCGSGVRSRAALTVY
jgi:hypothetical protein